MADNVSITAGSGTVIASDDVGGVQFQKMKLDKGGDGVSTPVTGADGMPVMNTIGAVSPVTWTSATALNTDYLIDTTGMSIVRLTLNVTVTATGSPAIAFAVNDGSGTFFSTEGVRLDEPVRESTHSLVQTAGYQQMWQFGVSGTTQLRIRLTAVMTAGSVTLRGVPVGGTSRPWTVTEEAVSNTATLANVASSASSVTIAAFSPARRGWMLFNDSTAILYLAFSTSAASTTAFTVKVAPGGFYEMPTPCYTGQITGIWSAANGSARITELS